MRTKFTDIQAIERAAAEDFERKVNRRRHLYTVEGVAEEQNKIYAGLGDKVEALKAEIFEQLDTAIEGIATQANTETAKRAADPQYLPGLAAVCDFITRFDTTNAPSVEQVRPMLERYANDTLACRLIYQRILPKFPGLIEAMPPMNFAERQAQAQAVKQLIGKYCRHLRHYQQLMAADRVADTGFLNAEILAFNKYLEMQTDDFSRPIDEIFDAIAKDETIRLGAEKLRWDLKRLTQNHLRKFTEV